MVVGAKMKRPYSLNKVRCDGKGMNTNIHCASMLPSLHRLSISAKGNPGQAAPSSSTEETTIEYLYDKSGISQADARAWWERGNFLSKGNFGEVRDVPFLSVKDKQSGDRVQRVVIKRSNFTKQETAGGENDLIVAQEMIFQNQRAAIREYWAHMDIWSLMKKAGTEGYITQPIPMQVPCKNEELYLDEDRMVNSEQAIGAPKKRNLSPPPSSPPPSSTARTLVLPRGAFPPDSSPEPSPAQDSESRKTFRTLRDDFKRKYYPCTLDPVTRAPIEHVFTIQALACDEDCTLQGLGAFFESDTNFARLDVVAAEVGRALHALHATGYAHRDLSTNNVVVCTKRLDGGVTIKLIDFGMSAKMSSPAFAIDAELAKNPFRTLNERFKKSSSFDNFDFYAFVRQAYAASAAP